MTVSYSREVSNAKLALFLRLLWRWKGSIYRLILPEMIVYLILYYLLAVFYQFFLRNSETSRKIFQNVSIYCNRVTNDVPVTFVVGFFLVFIINRWWSIFQAIPWPDRAAFRIQYVSFFSEFYSIILINMFNNY